MARLRQKETAETEKLLNIQENLRMESENFQILRQQYEELNIQLRNDETERRLNEIQKRIAELRQIISRVHSEYDRERAQFEQISTHFHRAGNDLLNRAERVNAEVLDAAVAIQLDSLITIIETLRQTFETTEGLSPEKVAEAANNVLPSVIRQLESLKETSTYLLGKLQENLDQSDEKLRALCEEKESLEKGRFQFPKNAIDLKHAIISQIKAKTGGNAEVVLVAEAAEIRNDRWRNAIEGYLNTQKFYIIVPPRFVRLAIRVFDRIKRDKAVYDTGVVDVEKILANHYQAEANSLATEIDTDNQYVRAYLDYLLGRVMKCDNSEYIRDYPISITDEGLLYKNYVVRALNPKLWRNPAIGQNAIALRLEEIKNEIAAEKSAIETCSSLKIGAEACKKLDSYSQNDA